jgi:hypothetical protein
LSPKDPELEEKKKFIESNLMIPEWLEFGACTPNTIALIRSGLNRSAAIQAAKQIPKTFSGYPLTLIVEEK